VQQGFRSGIFRLFRPFRFRWRLCLRLFHSYPNDFRRVWAEQLCRIAVSHPRQPVDCQPLLRASLEVHPGPVDRWRTSGSGACLRGCLVRAGWWDFVFCVCKILRSGAGIWPSGQSGRLALRRSMFNPRQGQPLYIWMYDPQCHEHSWDGYVHYTKVLISFQEFGRYSLPPWIKRNILAK
jgi:hypothetical protein